MLISIITPSYNQGEFIERTIQSVLSQSDSNFEYIIMDGLSRDHTKSILQKYSDKIRFVSERDNGQAHAVNKGLRMSSGDIIGWLNSDDIYYPHTLSKVRDFFSTCQTVDVLYGDAYHINEHDEVLNKYYTEPWNPEKLKEICYICQPTVFFKRTIIESHGLLDEHLQYCMDYEYWLRLAKNGVRFAYFPQLLASSRLHADTKTLGSRVAVHAEINNMLHNKFKKVPDRWLSNYAHALIEERYKDIYSVSRLKRAIAFQTLLSAVYWNKWPSQSLIRTVLKWILASIKEKNAGKLRT